MPFCMPLIPKVSLRKTRLIPDHSTLDLWYSRWRWAGLLQLLRLSTLSIGTSYVPCTFTYLSSNLKTLTCCQLHSFVNISQSCFWTFTWTPWGQDWPIKTLELFEITWEQKTQTNSQVPNMFVTHACSISVTQCSTRLAAQALYRKLNLSLAFRRVFSAERL
jgi:hypothetical protein